MVYPREDEVDAEQDREVVVHQGRVAVCDLDKENLTLAVRDRLAAENGISCFDTEAFGVSGFPTVLIIRGIVDYADSHRNDK